MTPGVDLVHPLAMIKRYAVINHLKSRRFNTLANKFLEDQKCRKYHNNCKVWIFYLASVTLNDLYSLHNIIVYVIFSKLLVIEFRYVFFIFISIVYGSISIIQNNFVSNIW